MFGDKRALYLATLALVTARAEAGFDQSIAARLPLRQAEVAARDGDPLA